MDSDELKICPELVIQPKRKQRQREQLKNPQQFNQATPKPANTIEQKTSDTNTAKE